MTEEKQNIQHTPFPPEEERRTEYVGAKVTPGQKRHIRRLADECGMTVSNYMLARAFGYRPKARLTARQEAGQARRAHHGRARQATDGQPPARRDKER